MNSDPRHLMCCRGEAGGGGAQMLLPSPSLSLPPSFPPLCLLYSRPSFQAGMLAPMLRGGSREGCPACDFFPVSQWLLLSFYSNPLPDPLSRAPEPGSHFAPQHINATANYPASQVGSAGWKGSERLEEPKYLGAHARGTDGSGERRLLARGCQ